MTGDRGDVSRTHDPSTPLRSADPPTGWLRRIAFIVARELPIVAEQVDAAVLSAWREASATGLPLTDFIMVHQSRQHLRRS